MISLWGKVMQRGMHIPLAYLQNSVPPGAREDGQIACWAGAQPGFRGLKQTGIRLCFVGVKAEPTGVDKPEEGTAEPP